MAVVRFPICADFVSSGLIEELVRPVRVTERAMASHIARITDEIMTQERCSCIENAEGKERVFVYCKWCSLGGMFQSVSKVSTAPIETQAQGSAFTQEFSVNECGRMNESVCLCE